MMLSNGKQLLQKANEVAGRARLDRDVEMVLRKERGVTLQQQSMLQHVLIVPIPKQNRKHTTQLKSFTGEPLHSA